MCIRDSPKPRSLGYGRIGDHPLRTLVVGGVSSRVVHLDTLRRQYEMKRVQIALLAVMACLGLTLTLIGAKILVWREAQDKLVPPVDLPLSTSAKEFSVRAFAVPQDGDYLIAVSAERAIPSNTLDCLLGIDDALIDKCAGIPAAINANWIITADGREIAHGASKSERAAGWSTRVYKGIGRFPGTRGKLYKLDVSFLSDNSQLSPAKPHIEVHWLPPTNYDEYGNSMRSVSYTHLDVYKRQGEDSDGPDCVPKPDGPDLTVLNFVGMPRCFEMRRAHRMVASMDPMGPSHHGAFDRICNLAAGQGSL